MVHRVIRFLTFNVRSLASSSRQIQLSNILHHYQIDIGFIEECHLHANKKVKLVGYNFIHGVAVFIKNTINLNKLNFSGIRLNNSFIEMNCTQKILAKNTLQVLDLFHEDLNKIPRLTNSYDGFIVGGDLNAESPNWGDTYANSNVKVLYD